MLNLCACVLVAGIINVLAPEGQPKKLLKTISGMFVFCCIISPLANLGSVRITLPDFDVPAEEQAAFKNCVDGCVLNMSGEKLRQMVVQRLGEEGINFNAVRVNMDIDENNSIFINELTVCTQTAGQEEKIKSIVKESFGLDCTVTKKEEE